MDQSKLNGHSCYQVLYAYATTLPTEKETEEVIFFSDVQIKKNVDMISHLEGLKVNEKFSQTINFLLEKSLWQKADRCDVYKKSVWQRNEAMKSEASTRPSAGRAYFSSLSVYTQSSARV